MLLIDCPYCGPRPELEFRYGGEAHLVRDPDPARTSDAQWTEYLYFRRNPRGAHAERWRHVHGCGRFFNAIRDTVTDRFAATYRAGERPPAPAKQATTSVEAGPGGRR
jgi:sarcosine oxidase, subunit delta